MTSTPEQYADAPICSPLEDRFSRWPFSERIARVLAARMDPSSIVVGLYGQWGEGKTSVLNMMARAFEQHEHVVCVAFNPWHFDDKRHLIRAFFDTFADSMDEMPTPAGEDLRTVLQKYAELFSRTFCTFVRELSSCRAARASTG